MTITSWCCSKSRRVGKRRVSKLPKLLWLAPGITGAKKLTLGRTNLKPTPTTTAPTKNTSMPIEPRILTAKISRNCKCRPGSPPRSCFAFLIFLNAKIFGNPLLLQLGHRSVVGVRQKQCVNSLFQSKQIAAARKHTIEIRFTTQTTTNRLSASENTCGLSGSPAVTRSQFTKLACRAVSKFDTAEKKDGVILATKKYLLFVANSIASPVEEQENP